MSSNDSEDRASLSAFTFADGRRCRLPRPFPDSEYCHHHQRKLRHLREHDDTARNIALPLIGEVIAPSSLNFAVARVFAAVAEGRISSKTANTLTNLAKVLLKTIPNAQRELLLTTRNPACWDDIVRQIYNLPDPDAASPSPPRDSSSDDPEAT
ncbi:MAG TPA: hypothetical protein VKA02_10260 [Candidatus Acidoferrum sp.]|nr:hypothetical protein [Candidatus Acidoferrum sp.]